MKRCLEPQGNRPRVTLAVFAYNQESYIREALESALSQTYEPLELVITDDCSQDETFTKIQQIIACYNGPHYVTVHRNDINLGRERWDLIVNNAVDRAQGELIVLAAGDDISEPHRVERLVAAWVGEGRPSGILHSAVFTLPDNPALSGNLLEDGATFGSMSPLGVVRNDGEGVLGASMAFTKDLFSRFGPLPPGTLFEDRVLGFRAILTGKVCYLREPLVRYRIHDGNVSGSNIYADAARWERFCRGHRTLFAAFRHDFQLVRSGATTDSLILSSIDARLRHVARTEKLITGTPIERVFAAYHVSSRQLNWRYRASFILKHSGLDRLKVVSFLRRLARRLVARKAGG